MRKLAVILLLFCAGCNFVPSTEGEVRKKFLKAREVNGDIVIDHYVTLMQESKKGKHYEETDFLVSENIFNQLHEKDYFIPEPKAEQEKKVEEK